ncbi:hypothetical protein CP97_14711 [Aurantiacibacter atlanticus]|uniref:Uncharacterized protein n=1 Tax=Aurantiacibacter atlanticus TaxID=1648404 RepID=A0A168M198_9SPHN|nr:hypothetical protein CP97_14711 [Aurantiacibacter atlanticus]
MASTADDFISGRFDKLAINFATDEFGYNTKSIRSYFDTPRFGRLTTLNKIV